MITDVVQIIFVLLFSVIFHECAHGWIAGKLGDPTARLAGRLTLNPLKHIDPLGTIIVPLVLRLLGFLPLGWAKPVPVNFARLHHPKRDMIWVALAGPATNIGLAILFSQLLKLTALSFLQEFFILAVMVNLILAIFNLAPIPPLDGSRILMGLLPNSLARTYSRLEPFGLIIVSVLFNFGLLDFIWTIVAVLAALLGVGIRF